MATPNQARSGNELGAKTTYQLFLEKENLPVVRGFHVEDINALQLLIRGPVWVDTVFI